MAVNKVEVGGEAVIDLTADTVSENNLLAGATAHNSAGEPITGAVVAAPIDSELSDTSENPVQNKVIKKVLDEMGGGLKMITGTYIGSSEDPLFVDIGVTPAALILMQTQFATDGSYYRYGVAAISLFGSPYVYRYINPSKGDTITPLIEIVENGFNVYGTTTNDVKSKSFNKTNFPYNYIAFVQYDEGATV